MEKSKLAKSSLIIFLIVIILVIAFFFIFKIKLPIPIIDNLFSSKTLSNKELLKDAEFWIYDINFNDESDLDKIKNSNYDVVVVDISDTDKDKVEELKKDSDKLILCYMNIGQAESYRDYWQNEWKEGNPEWIKEEDLEWEGNFNIDFTNNEWHKILYEYDNSYLHTILLNGYDGVYLDLTGIDYWESKGEEKEGDMINLVEQISDKAKEKDKEFLVVAQNLAFLKNDYSNRLKDKIDGVGQEEVFYGYENEDGLETPFSVSHLVIDKLSKYQEEKFPVFVLDYPFNCEQKNNFLDCYNLDNIKRMRDSYSKGWQKNYVMYDLFREANGVVLTIPRISKISFDYDNLPILTWKTISGNSKDAQSAYRIFVSSTKDKLEKDEADVFDSGKLWGKNISYGFIPDKEIEEGTYYWKAVVYEIVNDIELVSPWSGITELIYQKEDSDLDNDISEDLIQTAWIPNWAFDKGFNSLKNNKDKFESISPVWFSVLDDGSLKSESSYNNMEFISFCKENNILLIPSIPLFDPQIFSQILNSNLDNHVNNIIYEVENGNYDGIDIDYEATYLKDNELYFKFLNKLSKKLHEENKMLSITVLSKWVDANIYGWRSETRQVQDYKEIGKYADEIRIMAYDYSSQNSYIPGPMSPIYWDNQLLKYAVDKVSKDKIILALPLYGYSFRIDEKSNISTDIFAGGDIGGAERRIIAFTYEEIESLKNDYILTESIDSYSGEKVLTYNDKRYDRKLYILDSESINSRKKLASSYQIKGVAYWRLGGDDQKCFE